MSYKTIVPVITLTLTINLSSAFAQKVPILKVTDPIVELEAEHRREMSERIANRLLQAGSVDSLKAIARRGDAQAMEDVGFLYEAGLSVQKNAIQAFGWYLGAAQHGLLSAQATVCKRYRVGLGTIQDYAEAYAWCSIVITRGTESPFIDIEDIVLSKEDLRDLLIKKDREFGTKEMLRAEELLREYFASYVLARQ